MCIRDRGHAAALMTILIWGTTFVSTKVLLRDFTPVTVLFTRFVIAVSYTHLTSLKRLSLEDRTWLLEQKESHENNGRNKRSGPRLSLIHI